MCGQKIPIERNTVYSVDCMEVLKELPDESVDLILADPPYYRMKGDFDFVFQSVKEYLDWCRIWVAECYRVLKPTGAFYCFGSERMLDWVSVEVLNRLDWLKRNLIVWDYVTGLPGKASYRFESEFVWFYSKDCHVLNHDAVRIPYSPGQEKDKRKNPKGKTCGNVWRFPRVRANSREATGHPTQKPEQLSERMVLASSKTGDLVFIPFAGSGSEILSCLKNKRDFIAAEINPAYVRDIIYPRISEVVQNSSVTWENGNIQIILDKEGESK